MTRTLAANHIRLAWKPGCKLLFWDPMTRRMYLAKITGQSGHYNETLEISWKYKDGHKEFVRTFAKRYDRRTLIPHPDHIQAVMFYGVNALPYFETGLGLISRRISF